MSEFITKMQVLKDDYALMLDSKYKEGMVLHVHRNGLWSIVTEARRVSQIPGIKEKPKEVKDAFEAEWKKVL